MKLPVVAWLPGYERRWLRGDLAAGIAVTALVVPKNLGYADIAGVPLEQFLFGDGRPFEYLVKPRHWAGDTRAPSASLGAAGPCRA